MGRKILFITTDQMRYDSLGCNGGKIAQTPVLDRLAEGLLNHFGSRLPVMVETHQREAVKTREKAVEGLPEGPRIPAQDPLRQRFVYMDGLRHSQSPAPR